MIERLMGEQRGSSSPSKERPGLVSFGSEQSNRSASDRGTNNEPERLARRTSTLEQDQSSGVAVLMG